MKLTEILEYIKNKLREDERLNSVFIDDVYRCFNSKNDSANFTSAVLDYVSTNVNETYCDYQFVIYVGSVINENEKNIYRHISIADSIITTLLHKIEVAENEVYLVVPATVNPFSQQFADVMAGCWCRFSVRVPMDIICE